MAIDSVALRLQSESLMAADLVELVGVPAFTSASRGMPVSSRRPDGAVHSVSTASFNLWDRLESLDGVVPQILELLTRVTTRDDLVVDVVVAVTARPLGYIMDLSAEQLRSLGLAGCGISFVVRDSGVCRLSLAGAVKGRDYVAQRTELGLTGSRWPEGCDSTHA